MMTGTNAAMVLDPIGKVISLKGADSAKLEAVQSEVSVIRKEALALTMAEQAADLDVGKTWLEGSLAIFTGHSQEALKAGLKADETIEKGTSQYVQLSYIRTLYKAYLTFDNNHFKALTLVDEKPLARAAILNNVRKALKDVKEAAAEERLIKSLNEAADTFGITDETERQIAIDKAIDARQAELDAKELEKTSIQGQAKRMAAKLFKAGFTTEDVTDFARCVVEEFDELKAQAEQESVS